MYSQAKELLSAEIELVRRGMGHEDVSLNEFVEAHQNCVEDFTYLPSRSTNGLLSLASSAEQVEARKFQLENLRAQIQANSKKIAKLEQKGKVLTKGYLVSFFLPLFSSCLFSLIGIISDEGREM